MKVEDFLKSKTEVTYSLLASHDGIEYFTLSGRKSEYESPKKLIAALNATPFPPDFKSYKDLRLIKHTKTVTVTEEDISKYLDLTS